MKRDKSIGKYVYRVRYIEQSRQKKIPQVSGDTQGMRYRVNDSG